MKYIDIHCHLDFKDYDSDRVDVFGRMEKEEVGAITISANWGSSKKAVEIAESNENVWAIIGVHCEGIFEKSYNFKKEIQDELSGLVKSSKVVGIGECGLEYFFMKKEEAGDLQKKLFEAQIEFALEHDKPMMLHLRPSKKTFDAYEDAVGILGSYKKWAGEKLRGNIHFFSGDIGVAKRFLDLGFTMSFTGVITFTHDYNEVIKYIPSGSIMSETDAPFVAPVPHRGKRNEPVYVIEVVKKLAELKGESTEKMSGILLANAQRMFNLKIPARPIGGEN